MTLPNTRDGAWSAVTALVAGIGVTGFAAADALLRSGVRVLVVDGRDDDEATAKAHELSVRGADVQLGSAVPAELPTEIDVLVASPGWRPDAPLIASALSTHVPVWSEIELAWRLRDPHVPWLAVTGTNGKTTTVQMLASMLRAGGRAAVAAGNVGRPLVTTVLEGGYDALAVEMSSFQLHFTHTMAADAAAALNVAPDHLDWHGSLAAYAVDKARIFRNARVRVFNADDPTIVAMVDQRDERDQERGAAKSGARDERSDERDQEYGHCVGFTLGEPQPEMLGVDGDVLIDRAFGAAPESRTDPVRLATTSDIPVAGPHNVANALAAAALARSAGISPSAVRDGLRDFQPEPHRVATVATVGSVTYVDDSKATNPHAAAASLLAFEPGVVWVAGGLAKGAEFGDLVVSARDKLRAVVLIGADKAKIREALARHAPDVPVVDVAGDDNKVMSRVVEAAAQFAQPGDTVLLAPACASMDIFANYAARGDAFADAVRRYGIG
jgi:UDP-N-acetylmuramoylalanine--D-glutamate ligase